MRDNRIDIGGVTNAVSWKIFLRWSVIQSSLFSRRATGAL